MIKTDFLTKYEVPRIREDYVSRPRLVEKIRSGGSTRVHLITAPAAYGKTCLLTEIAERSRLPTCWFSIDEMDVDPLSFVQGVRSSIKSKFAEFDAAHAFSTTNENSNDLRHLAVDLVNAIHDLGNQSLLLIWDDFHRVSGNQQISQLAGLIIENLPQNSELIIASRSMPEIDDLERLIAYRDVGLLSAEDLAFTTSECHALLTFLTGQDVPARIAEEMRARTEGWVGGLLSAESSPTVTSESVTSDAQALRVFASSAIAQESTEFRHWLMTTSVFPYLDPGICNAVFNIQNSEAMLAKAYVKIGFLSRTGGNHDVYKWHDLIREGLESKFKLEDPEQHSETIRRIAQVLESRREIDHAVTLFLRAKEEKEAGRLLAQHGDRFIAEGRWGMLDHWLSEISETVILDDYLLLALRGRVTARIGEKETAIRYYNGAMELLKCQEAPIPTARTLIARSSTYTQIGFDVEAEADAKAAVTILQTQKGHESDLSRAYRQLGWIDLYRGRLKEAEEWLTLSSITLRRDADLHDTASVSAALGWVSVELGKMPEAHTYLDNAVQSWRKIGNQGSLAISLNNLALMWHRQGQLDVARTILEEALEKATSIGYTRTVALVRASLGDVAKDEGRFDDALDDYGLALDLARETSEGNLVSYTLSALGDVYRLQGEFKKAEVLLDEAIALAKSQEQLHEHALALMYKAMLYARIGDYSEAKQGIEETAGILRQSGSKHDLALLNLYNAQIMFLEKDFAACREQLENLAERCAALGYSGFLTAEARRAPALFQWAASVNIGNELFQKTVMNVRGVSKEGNNQYADAPGRLSLRIEAYAFGESRVVIGGQDVTHEVWGSPKARELFFYLIANQAPKRRDAIIADLWPEQNTDTSNNNFHSSLRRLRLATHPMIATYENGTYRVNQDFDIWVDLTAFNQLIDRADQMHKGSDKRAKALREALGLYTGPLLDEFYSEWAETIRIDAEAKFLRALASLAGYYAAKKNLSLAVNMLERAARVDRLEEQIRIELMRCFLDKGEAQSALRVYEDFSRVLKDELNEPPSSQLRAIHEEALAKI